MWCWVSPATAAACTFLHAPSAHFFTEEVSLLSNCLLVVLASFLVKKLLQQQCMRQDELFIQHCEINGNTDCQGAFTAHFLSQFHHCLLLFFDVWLKRHRWCTEWGQQVLHDHYGQLLRLCDTLGSWGDVRYIWRLISFGDFKSFA